MQPTPQQSSPRVLGDAESIPDLFVLEFCDQAVRRFRDELADVQDRDQAREEQAQHRVVDALTAQFQRSAGSRDWAVPERRVRQLADDAIGLSLEFQHAHGYEPEGARWAAVRECLEGEQARELIADQQRELAARGRDRQRLGGER
jgi:hypothetical protein